MGRYDESLELLREGLRIRRRIHGNRSAHTAQLLKTIATMLGLQGKLEEALEKLEEAQSIFKGSPGPEKASLANLLDEIETKWVIAIAAMGSWTRSARRIPRRCRSIASYAATKARRWPVG